ncbi:MAG: hypothetical protein JW832_08880 [Deltaproteobacteria bacterium]|nr:hypothetical protein [Deltaproteobacteria bacterium]
MALVAFFIASRIVFYFFGGLYIVKPIGFALQYLDPRLLQHDLLQSLLYQHSQPPLFNFFLGLVLKLSADPSISFQLLYQTAGLLALLALYGLLRAVRLPSAAALIVAAFFILNPTVILYEHLLYYTYIEGVFILFAAFCLLEWFSTRQALWACAFWLMLACLGGIRSLFHPIFFLVLSGIFGLYMFLKMGQRRQALVFCAASLIAIAPLGLLCAKNYAVFGFFGTSSWDGMSLWTKACGYGPDELEHLHRRGVISSLAVQAELEAFRALDQYADGKKLIAAACHHPADCEPFKTTGRPNFNHTGYIRLSRQLWKDSLSIIRDDPGRFAFQTLGAYSLTLWYASDSVHALFKSNMEILAPLEAAYRYLYFGFLGVQNRHSDARMWLRTGCVSLLFLVFNTGAIVQVFRARSGRDSAIAGLCLFCMLIHAYTIAVSSIIEFGENNRFRFPVDGAFLVLMAGCLTAFFPSRRGRGVADSMNC